MGSIFGGKKTPAAKQAVLAARPQAIERDADEVTSSTKNKRRVSYGIDDTFMRAFSQSSGGTTTLGS